MTTKDKRPRTCPECGSDTIWAREFDRIQDEKSTLYDRFKKVMAQHGVDRAQWELEKVHHEVKTRWLQQKVDSQRKALNRLENKLIELGRKPYQEESEVGLSR